MHSDDAYLAMKDYFRYSNGRPYLASQIYSDNSEIDKKHRQDSIYCTFHFLDTLDSYDLVDTSIISLDGNRYISSLMMYEKNDTELVFGGYYHTDNTYVRGLFVLSLNLESMECKKNYYPIPIDVMNEYETDKQIRVNTLAEQNSGAGLK